MSDIAALTLKRFLGLRREDYLTFVTLYQSQIPPNQALEPTTPAVTIPAAQEVAPAGVVAHL